MNSKHPLSIAQYVKTLPACNRAMAYLCLDEDGVVIGSGGELEQCGIPSLENGLSVNEQLPAIGELLPIYEHAVVILNMQTAVESFTDLHLFADSAGQWVLLFDNTEAGVKLQSEQQERLCNAIAEEKISCSPTTKQDEITTVKY